MGGYANGTWVATAPAVSTSTAAPGEIAHPPLAKEKKEAKQHCSRVGERGETRDTDMHTESQLTDRDRPLLLIAAKGRTDGREKGREGQGRQRRQFFELAHPHRVSWGGR